MHPEEVDVIIAGGGPAGRHCDDVTIRYLTYVAGSVVAGRLAYADPNLKVMLIEGGANNRDDPWVYRCIFSYNTPNLLLTTTLHRPGIYVRNMQQDGM